MKQTSSMLQSSLWVADLAWDIVAARLAAGAPAILPIGAGAKQHGWHLPMGSDRLQAAWLAERLADRLGALVWPVVTYGHYPAFTGYAGSISLSEATFVAMLGEILNGLLSFGARSVLVLNTGISTLAPADKAIAASVEARRVLHLRAYEGVAYRVEAARGITQAHGSHADELETSCLLALAPDRVDMDRAAASPDVPPGAGPMQHLDPLGTNYSASGTIGAPASATRAKGEALLAAMLDDMMATIRSAEMRGGMEHPPKASDSRAD